MVSESATAAQDALAVLTPPAPTTVEETGLDLDFLVDLALKTVYAETAGITRRADRATGEGTNRVCC